MSTGFREVGFGFDEPQAHIVKARLEDAGFWCDVRPADSSSLGAFAIGAFFPCSVRVRERDYERAVGALEFENVDWDAIDIGVCEDDSARRIASLSDEEARSMIRQIPMWLRVAAAFVGGLIAARLAFLFAGFTIWLSAALMLVVLVFVAVMVSNQKRAATA